MTAIQLQPSFDDLSPALSEVTFVVVDLETTGSTGDDTITEFGAVKVRGGEILGEFQTLVNPRTHIPALIAVLTGITDALVADAPQLHEVVPSWLEFAGDAVLVAHNAGFDIGFLKRACATHGYPWPGNDVIDTVGLARSVLLRDEVPNVKLSTLARHVRSTHEANHRALSDARVTVDVLHYLLERVGNLGVHTLADLVECTRRVSPERRAKRKLAEGLPAAPGVYQFVADLPDATGVPRRQVLYVGKSRNIRQRVRSYFTAAETRPRMEEMVRIATGVEATVCRTELEAEVLELRLIAAHSPRYNRRSKFPERQHWVKVTNEPFPRLSIVTSVGSDGATYFGPFHRRLAAEQTVAALHDAYPIRQCTTRLSVKKASPACALAELGRCCAPCQLAVSRDDYATLTDQVRGALTSDVRPVLESVRPRMRTLVDQQRFEEAGQLRSRLETFISASVKHHRLASLAGCSQIVAAYRIDPDTSGYSTRGVAVSTFAQARQYRFGTDAAWEIHVVRHGRLVSAAVAHPGEIPQAVARAAVASADTISVAASPAALVEETERIAAWLERPGVRLIEVDGDWSWPLHASIAEGQLPGYALGVPEAAAGATPGQPVVQP